MASGNVNFYDEKNNFLFVRKGENSELLDYIFIHKDDDDKKNFMAHYESYKADYPIEVYKMEKVDSASSDCLETINFLDNGKLEMAWKSVRVSSILRSQWRIFFENLISL